MQAEADGHGRAWRAGVLDVDLHEAGLLPGACDTHGLQGLDRGLGGLVVSDVGEHGVVGFGGGEAGAGEAQGGRLLLGLRLGGVLVANLDKDHTAIERSRYPCFMRVYRRLRR